MTDPMLPEYFSLPDKARDGEQRARVEGNPAMNLLASLMTDAEISERAARLLEFILTVEEWAKAADPRAQPYFDANAVRWRDDGHLSFHATRFISVMLRVKAIP